MLISADQVLAHAVGDFILQSDWQASKKTGSVGVALVHAVLYVLPFLFLTRSWPALGVIAISHFVIDHWRLARHVGWAKNFLGPRYLSYKGATVRNLPWKECSSTGYPADKPPFMAVWLMIIVDQIMHLLVNGLVLKYLG